MKKLILKWLFGIEDIEKYIDLLHRAYKYNQECIKLVEDNIKTLESQKEDLNNIRKLIIICENHGIDVDEEIKHIEL